MLLHNQWNYVRHISIQCIGKPLSSSPSIPPSLARSLPSFLFHSLSPSFFSRPLSCLSPSSPPPISLSLPSHPEGTPTLNHSSIHWIWAVQKHTGLDAAIHCGGMSGTCLRAAVVNLLLLIIQGFGSRVGAGGVEKTLRGESRESASWVPHWLIQIGKLSQYSTFKYQLLCLLNIIWWQDGKVVLLLFCYL